MQASENLHRNGTTAVPIPVILFRCDLGYRK
jgi:hypothetical protein